MNIQHHQLESLLIERIRQLSTQMKPKPASIIEHLPHLENIRAVLFDVYGTLFISGTGDISLAREMSNKHALTEALISSGFSGNLRMAGVKGTQWLLQAIQRTHATQRKEGIGSPEVDIRHEWKTVLEQLRQENLIQEEITSETVVRVSVEYEYRVNPVWPMPDLVETLNSLKTKQLLLGIVSNAQFYTQLLFPAFLGKSCSESGFSSKLCAWSYQFLEAKPSRNLFRGLVENLQHIYGISPNEVLYIGNDKLNDIWPAAELGLRTCLFAGDQRSLRLRENEEKCATLEPDAIITRLSQIIEIIHSS